MARTKKTTKVVEQPETIVETVNDVETVTKNETVPVNIRSEYSLETHYRELIKSIDTRR